MFNFVATKTNLFHHLRNHSIDEIAKMADDGPRKKRKRKRGAQDDSNDSMQIDGPDMEGTPILKVKEPHVNLFNYCVQHSYTQPVWRTEGLPYELAFKVTLIVENPLWGPQPPIFKVQNSNSARWYRDKASAKNAVSTMALAWLRVGQVIQGSFGTKADRLIYRSIHAETID
jgi:hypothetical protein